MIELHEEDTDPNFDLDLAVEDKSQSDNEAVNVAASTRPLYADSLRVVKHVNRCILRHHQALMRDNQVVFHAGIHIDI